MSEFVYLAHSRILNYLTWRQGRKFAGSSKPKITRVSFGLAIAVYIETVAVRTSNDDGYRNWLLAWKSRVPTYARKGSADSRRRNDNSRRRYDEFSVMLITVCDTQSSIPIKLPANIRLAATAAIWRQQNDRFPINMHPDAIMNSRYFTVNYAVKHSN